MAKIELGGITENVITLAELPLVKAVERLEKETVAVIGYNPLGRSLALNLRDSGADVVVGLSGNDKIANAGNDNWIAGKNLLDTSEACSKATLIYISVPLAEQISLWPVVSANTKAGDAICFPDGFAVAYRERTGIIPPEDADILLFSPRANPEELRENYISSNAVDSYYGIFSDSSGKALERISGLGIAGGATHLFKTDFNHQARAKMTGEIGSLSGALQGIFAAQYQVLRDNGHTPSEAFNMTVEEFRRSISSALPSGEPSEVSRISNEWWERFRDAALPVFRTLYDRVATGYEAQKVIETIERTKSEIDPKLISTEMWKAGKALERLKMNKYRGVTTDNRGKRTEIGKKPEIRSYTV